MKQLTNAGMEKRAVKITAERIKNKALRKADHANVRSSPINHLQRDLRVASGRSLWLPPQSTSYFLKDISNPTKRSSVRAFQLSLSLTP